MKCPECVKEGKTSRVYPKGRQVTLLGYHSYFDEAGVYHDHDPNRVTDFYRCSNGHEYTTKSMVTCPAGDFGGPIQG